MIKPQFSADLEKNYQTHLTRLKLSGMQPKTIAAYSRAVRRAGQYFDYQINARIQLRSATEVGF